ncbi:MAG: hypothetical protein FJ104_10250 [Deltaproteobacteria bacterium]|nr:hypothetical protein [Deltaproteobacteria bacterium]
MLEMRGRRKRRLALLTLPGPSVPQPGTPVTGPSGELLGETRSAAVSARLGGVGVLAVLPLGASEPGARVLVGGTEAVVAEPR